MNVSVVMTVYNGELYIEKQLKSILNQTYNIDEIIIINDCSNDSSIELIEKINSKKVKIIKNELNQGVVASFFKGINLATNECIFLADQDDIWELNKVEKYVEKFKSNDRIGVLTSSYRLIDCNDKVINKKKYPLYKEGFVKLEDVLGKNIFPGCTIAFRKEYKKYFTTLNRNIYIHDWYLVLISSYKGTLYYFDEILFNYRIHDNNTIGLNTSYKPKYGLAKRIKSLKNKISLYKYLINNIDFNLEDNILINRYILLNKNRLKAIEKKSFSILTKNVLLNKSIYNIRLIIGDFYYIIKNIKGKNI